MAGIRLSTGAAGVRYKDRTDVLLAVMAPGTQVAGVFTKSKTSSAPVEWCRAQLKRGTARALVVNSGNANAFTGKAGETGARDVAELAGSRRRLRCPRRLHGVHRRDRRTAAGVAASRKFWARLRKQAPPAAGVVPPKPS